MSYGRNAARSASDRQGDAIGPGRRRRRPASLGLVQEVVEWGVPPAGAGLVGQFLEPAEVCLGDGGPRFLIGGVAEVDPAAERPRLAGGAEVVHLERAEVAGHRLFIRGS